MIKNKPYISVIIIVYDRKQFINTALKSLENQTLKKDLFEVIIVSNIELAINIFHDLNIRIIYSNLIKGTAKYSQGIQESKGEVICFLEDDDAFFKNKLEIVYNAFQNNSSLVFYKNNAYKTKDIENYLDKKRNNLYRKKYNYNVSSSISYKIFEQLITNEFTFNTSCMSVLKDFYEKPEILNLLVTPDIVGDELLALIPFRDKIEKKIIFDTTLLTFYRIHSSFSNSEHGNFNEFENQIQNLWKYYYNSWARLKIIFNEPKIIRKYVEIQQSRAKLYLSIVLNSKCSIKDLKLSLNRVLIHKDIGTLFVLIIKLFLPNKLSKKIYLKLKYFILEFRT